MVKAAKKTPMMEQYDRAKEACGDALLLFRMGDFYELFHDDAKVAAKILGLTLTARDKGENPIPMAGFPHHQLQSYLGKLIKLGHRAAVCEQVEDPKAAKGLVKREITQVVTPGTITDENLLDPAESNFLAAIAPAIPAKSSNGKAITSKPPLGIAWADLSTGRFFASTISSEELHDHLARIAPSECLVSDEDIDTQEQIKLRTGSSKTALCQRPPWSFSTQNAEKVLATQFKTKNLEGFGFEESDSAAVRAAGAIVEYLLETQRASLDHVNRITKFQPGRFLEIDESTRRNLELTRTMRDGSRDTALIGVINRTVTPMGARLLGDWLSHPLTEKKPIVERHEAVDESKSDEKFRAESRSLLKQVYDVQRLLSKISTGRVTPRDLRFIGNTLAHMPRLKAILTGRKSPLLSELEHKIHLCPEVRTAIESALKEDCPASTKDGNFIAEGFHKELDELRGLAKGGKEWIARYQADISSRTEIPNLKVGYNKVFGYYLEVTNGHKDKVPDDFIRKQTLKNAERYITSDLKEYEEKILAADEKSLELEMKLFVELRDKVHAELQTLQETASALANLDVICSLAELAAQRNYCRPEMVDEPTLEIIDGRHPVLEQIEEQGTFVSNDSILNKENGNLALITGPNMAGKSTYIRQVALITLMAQMGSFVPASKATIGIADRIFARVGASDELSRGQSTFMVEMTETARILNCATEKSLVILDEIGRGTSTYDGVSLAWAIVEHLHDEIQCRTYFATHYHELTELAGSLDKVANFNVAVKEWQEDLVFLHKIVPGATDKSYGIHVARLAGVPGSVNERAKQILSQLEQDNLDSEGNSKKTKPKPRKEKGQRGDLQLTLFGFQEHPLLDKIRETSIEDLTPMQALQMLQEWQSELQSD